MSDKNKLKNINQMWQEGKTIKEINDAWNLITVLPRHLETVKRNTAVDFTRRLPDCEKIFITRLALSGFYIMKDGKESNHVIKYSSFKFLKLYEGEDDGTRNIYG